MKPTAPGVIPWNFLHWVYLESLIISFISKWCLLGRLLWFYKVDFQQIIWQILINIYIYIFFLLCWIKTTCSELTFYLGLEKNKLIKCNYWYIYNLNLFWVNHSKLCYILKRKTVYSTSWITWNIIQRKNYIFKNMEEGKSIGTIINLLEIQSIKKNISIITRNTENVIKEFPCFLLAQSAAGDLLKTL